MKLAIAEAVAAMDAALLRGSPDDSFESVSTDSRTLLPGDLFVPLIGDTFDGHDFLAQAAERGAVGALVSCDLDEALLNAFPNVLRVEDTTNALSRLAGYVRSRFEIPVVGITGSNGKTTTKELTAAVLGEDALKPEASYNNVVGVSKTLLRLNDSHRCVVLEMGTNHFGEIAALVAFARPTIGVFLNVTKAHTEFLENEDGIAREKSALPLAAEWAVLNADDPRVIALAPRCKNVRTFGVREEADVRAENISLDEEGRASFDLIVQGGPVGRVDLPLYGRHHVYNALAASAVGALLSVPTDAIRERLAAAKPPKMRLERRDIQGVAVYNDAYNANPASVRAALEFFGSLRVPGRKWIVLGGMAEIGGDAVTAHREIAGWLSPAFCDVFVPLGDFADTMALAAQERGVSAILRCSGVEEAGRTLAAMCCPGDAVLLKASRRMQLERVLGAYELERHSRSETPER